MAFVVHIERAPAVFDRAIVQHRHALGGHALTDAPSKGAGALAVEIAFQPVANGFVQENAGPTGPQHHRHLARRRGARVQVGQGGVHGSVYVLLNLRVIKISEAKAATAAARAGFTARHALHRLLGNHRDRQTHQRAHVSGQGAVQARHHHHVILTGQPGHHLHDAGVFGAGHFFNAAQQRHFGRAVERGNRVKIVVE